jgi:hypothetical protein
MYLQVAAVGVLRPFIPAKSRITSSTEVGPRREFDKGGLPTLNKSFANGLLVNFEGGPSFGVPTAKFAAESQYFKHASSAALC